MKQKNINRHAAMVISALISYGYYDMKINRLDDYCEITLLEIILCPYSFCRVYEDGIIHYYEGSKVSFEGRAKTKKSIMDDILNKK